MQVMADNIYINKNFVTEIFGGRSREQFSYDSTIIHQPGVLQILSLNTESQKVSLTLHSLITNTSQ